MKAEYQKVNGKKPKCPGCGHLLEQHTKRGRCEAGSKTGLSYSCSCRRKPTEARRK